MKWCFLKILFILVVSTCSLLVLRSEYIGSSAIYLMFSVVLNSFLLFSFRKRAIFFDKFLGLLFWLGFWIKFTFIYLLFEGDFAEKLGQFDHSPQSLDKALIVSIVGILAIALGSFIREKFIFDYERPPLFNRLLSLEKLYEEHRIALWAIFYVFVFSFAILNYNFSIYQRGVIPEVVLPFKLSGVFTWFLLFGSTSIVCVLLNFELQRKKASLWLAPLVLLEGALLSTSMLSRAMIFNSMSLGLGTLKLLKKMRVKVNFGTSLTYLALFGILFIGTFVATETIRNKRFDPIANVTKVEKKAITATATKALEVDDSRLLTSFKRILVYRWLGIDGAMIISSYPRLGWPLWKKVWSEKYTNKGTSFFDREIRRSYISLRNLSEHHFVSMSGILAFFYYPGSYAFLFFGMVIVTIAASSIEYAVFRLGGGNLILCALMGQVLAYRFAHFGYVPARSYLIFGTIFLNLFIIYGVNTLLKRFRKNA